ncbi:MAG: enoyl-CoA hydratase [Alphaproteobacteria bacterium]
MDTASTDQPELLIEKTREIATLILNRPRQRNALSRSLIAETRQALADIDRDESIRLVILSGAGPAFCAGHDLKEIRANPDRAFLQGLFEDCSAMMMAVQSIRQPVIARVHGIATAAGCQLVASCDLAVAAADSHFATPGVNIGLFCSTPMVALSRAVPRKAAMEMLLTGEMVDAEKALGLGLINRIAPLDELEAVTDDLARTILSKSPVALKIGKSAFYRQIEMGVEDAYDYVSQVMTENMLERETEQGVDAFLTKQPPPWQKK